MTPQQPSNPAAPGNGTAAKSAATATASAVAALAAARDAAAALLDSRAALEDFERLRLRAARSPPPRCDAALHPENRRKNRYSDVLAPDHSRVVLVGASLEEMVAAAARGFGGGGGGGGGAASASAANERGGGEHSPSSSSHIGGYINASLLSSRPGEHPPWSYVAAQGPLTSTVADFWRLVAQLRSPAVVSLTRPEERGVEKCARYLPAGAYDERRRNDEKKKNSSAEVGGGGGGGGDGRSDLLLPHSAVFGGLRVSCGAAEAAGPGLVARRVAVEVVSSSSSSPSSLAFRHSLLHFHVDDWPDHGAPASSASLRAAAAAMRRAVDEAAARAAAAAREKEEKGGGEGEAAVVVGPPVVHCSAGAFFFFFFFHFAFFLFAFSLSSSLTKKA